jgi:hypothetical protein
VIIICLEAPKSIRETEKKNLKTLSSGQKNPKNSKNPKKTKKPKKNQKKTTGLVFFLKTRVFSNPALFWCYVSSVG